MLELKSIDVIVGHKSFLHYYKPAKCFLARNPIAIKALGRNIQKACYLAAVLSKDGYRISDVEISTKKLHSPAYGLGDVVHIHISIDKNEVDDFGRRER